MASYRRVAWNLCWWGCLLGVFQVAEAARIDVPMPSIQDLLNRANPVINENSLGYVQAYDSAFQYQQRSYSAPIQQAAKIPTPAIKDAVKGALKDGIKGGLKANAAGVAANAAVAAAVAAAGWVIDEAGKPVKKSDEGGTVTGDPSDDTYRWVYNEAPRGSLIGKKFGSLGDACKAGVWEEYPELQKLEYLDSQGNPTTQVATQGRCTFTHQGYAAPSAFGLQRLGSKCPSGAVDTGGACVMPTTTSLGDADYDSLNSVINAQSAAFRARLAKEACEGSLAPSRCYQALQDAASFLNSGPSSIQGPKTTSQTVNKNSDGTVTTETTTRDTKFDMKYDGTGADATPTTTTTKRDDKGNESVTTDKEAEDSSTGTAPKDDEKETASPCTTNCDGPAYKDLYTKTDVTKEGVIDSYAAKVKALPIMSAVGNFFTVNGGGSCPVWSGTIDIGFGQSVTLSNDFACQPWFTALSPAFHAVLMLVAAWLAFRVSILD